MKVISNIIALVAALSAVAFFASLATIIFNNEIRADPASFPYVFISIGCFLNTYALLILAAVFILLLVNAILRTKATPLTSSSETFKSRWKKALFSDDNQTTVGYFISTLISTGLVLFFISQLSYGLNHCG